MVLFRTTFPPTLSTPENRPFLITTSDLYHRRDSFFSLSSPRRCRSYSARVVRLVRSTSQESGPERFFFFSSHQDLHQFSFPQFPYAKRPFGVKSLCPPPPVTPLFGNSLLCQPTERGFDLPRRSPLAQLWTTSFPSSPLPIGPPLLKAPLPFHIPIYPFTSYYCWVERDLFDMFFFR